MGPYLDIAGLVAVAAITPGPNNLVVMRTAARSGLVGTLPAIAGVVLGGLALLALVSAGAGAAFAAEPRMRTAITALGCLYLAWLGVRLIVGSSGDDQVGEPTRLPAGVMGLFGYQLLNPKAWIMVLTASSAATHGEDAVRAFVQLGVLFAVIPTGCLLLWSWSGSLLTRWLQRSRVRLWLDRVMGGLLIGFSIVLVLEVYG